VDNGNPRQLQGFPAAYEAIQAILEYGEKVLVCAFENTTVDQTLRNIIALLKSTYGCSKETIERLVKRIGYRAKIASDIHPFCNHDELARAKIVGTTLHSSSSTSFSFSSIALHTIIVATSFLFQSIQNTQSLLVLLLMLLLEKLRKHIIFKILITSNSKHKRLKEIVSIYQLLWMRRPLQIVPILFPPPILCNYAKFIQRNMLL
jgi:hypothetical protein